MSKVRYTKATFGQFETESARHRNEDRNEPRKRERVKETEYRPCRDISTPGGKIQFVSFFDALLLGCSFMCLLVVVNVSRQENLLCFDKNEKKREGKKKKEKKKRVPPLCCLGP